jgi:exonuclease III
MILKQLSITQANIGGSRKKVAMHLFSKKEVQNQDILLIQEPTINNLTNPVSTYSQALSGQFHICLKPHAKDAPNPPYVCTYVNKRIDPSTWSIRHINQNLSVLTIQLAIGAVSIYNVYNPGRWHPGQSVLPALDQAIREASSRHHVVVGDFNLHHPMWDHEERPH